MPQISVVVPVYNAEKYLPRCIDSILAQTFQDFELILVDDGSPDGCPAICDEYAAKDSRIRVIHQANAGVSVARNAALDVAQGEYIVFVDSDDFIDCNYLQDLITWRSHDFVTAGYRWQAHDMTWYERVFPDESVDIRDLKKYPSKYMGKYYFGSPWATLMKRGIIEKNSIRFDTHIRSGEDTLFIFEYLQHASNVKIIPMCGYHYCFYPSSLVNQWHADYWKWKITIESTVAAFFCPCNEEENGSLLRRQFNIFRNLLQEYYLQRDKNVMEAICKHPFFKESIAYMKTHGGRDDQLLIYAAASGRFSGYMSAMRIISSMKCKWRSIFAER